MANKMLIDAAHPEETRVVVVRGQRVEEFDFESAQRKPLRGNIYLAKVMRVEPSLQAAFVDYGGNRHGFLAFSEIHPDYYQIPVADREALVAEEARSARESDDDEPRPRRGRRHSGPATARHSTPSVSSGPVAEDTASDSDGARVSGNESAGAEPESAKSGEPVALDSTNGDEIEANGGREEGSEGSGDQAGEAAEASPSVSDESGAELLTEAAPQGADEAAPAMEGQASEDTGRREAEAPAGESSDPSIEQFGAGDGLEEVPERRRPPRRHSYKIQEVIKRRQILLVQVVKEERGNKGAALTTYLSLAGRYSVLMPNTARGGGISRKITNAPDRKRLKSVAGELDVPNGMGVIVRTAGAARTKAEIKRDFEYLLRLWENVREFTLKSTAPALVHEEGSLIKRAIRDLYNKDIDEVLVAGDQGYKEAKDFMRMLAPSHAKVVKLDKETEPVFARFGVEKQLDAMFSNVVTLRSGGYLVINQTEALVAIDVNSGRATREHNIEDTAFKTNLEAAEEAVRQMRLRDLAGLIVIDFIDMDEKRNNRSVEKRLKDSLKNDRARIQVGSISPFGLLEMSRQRIRSGVVEGSSTPCPHCAGAGRVRSTPSVALHVLRHVEDALAKSASRNLIVKTRADVAFYVLNQKRNHLRQIEERFGVSVMFVADDKHNGVDVFTVEFGEPAAERPAGEAEARRGVATPAVAAEPANDDDATEAADDAEASEDGEAQAERAPDGEGGQKRRRRRRRRRGGERDADAAGPAQPDRDQDIGGTGLDAEHGDEPERPRREAAPEPRAEADDASGSEGPRKRRRGRRGGRAHREDGGSAPAERAAIRSEAGVHSDDDSRTSLDHDQDARGQEAHPQGEEEPAAHGHPNGQAPVEATGGSDHDRVEPVVAEASLPQSVHADGAGEVTAQAKVEDMSSREPAEAAEPEPALASTYDPAKTKRAGWWSKAKSAIGVKE